MMELDKKFEELETVMDMVSPKDVHLIFIGYNRVQSFGLQADIIRSNWPNGTDFWITAVFNGSYEWLVPGIYGENNFIKLDENNGYGLGALDAINAGLDFARHHNRPYVVLSNFDSGFLTQEGLMKVVNDFAKSGKRFCGGEDVHGVPVTDGLIFKREVLEEMFPILPEASQERMSDVELQKEYEETSLGFMNMEEIFYNAVLKAGLKDEWFKMDRGELPRLRFSTENTFWHIHEPKELKTLCLQKSIVQGLRVQRLLSLGDLSYFNSNVEKNPNVIDGEKDD